MHGFANNGGTGGGTAFVVTGNYIYGHSSGGYRNMSVHETVSGNTFYANTNVTMQNDHVTFISNTLVGAYDGVVSANNDNTLVGNTLIGGGIVVLTSNNNSVVGNTISYGPGDDGLDFGGNSNVFANNVIVNSGGANGLGPNHTSGSVMEGGSVTGQIRFGGSAGIVMKGVWANPTLYGFGNFADTSTYLVNYSTTPGVVQVYGYYALSGSTFTLDYANELYTSTATNLKVMLGNELASNFTVNWTSDTYAVSQLVTLTATDATHGWSRVLPRRER